MKLLSIPGPLQTPIGDLLVSFAKDQDITDEALPDALYYAGIYGLILTATTITVSVTIPLFACLAGGLFFVSFLMLCLYLPAATHLKKLRMGAAGEQPSPDQVALSIPIPKHIITGSPWGHWSFDDHDRILTLTSPPYSNIFSGDLVTLVSEALDGLTVIQAYGKQAYFVDVTSTYINDAHRTLFGSESLNLWLAFYCDFYGEDEEGSVQAAG